MPEAFFYQLGGDSPEAVLPRMLDMALQKGWNNSSSSVYILIWGLQGH